MITSMNVVPSSIDWATTLPKRFMMTSSFINSLHPANIGSKHINWERQKKNWKGTPGLMWACCSSDNHLHVRLLSAVADCVLKYIGILAYFHIINGSVVRLVRPFHFFRWRASCRSTAQHSGTGWEGSMPSHMKGHGERLQLRYTPFPHKAFNSADCRAPAIYYILDIACLGIRIVLLNPWHSKLNHYLHWKKKVKEQDRSGSEYAVSQSHICSVW